MTTRPGDDLAAASRGRMRSSHADREQAIEVLKDAFAQGRLDKDELEARVGHAFASRTYAQLVLQPHLETLDSGPVMEPAGACLVAAPPV
jgi:Domain of unknown function (DUF1707)